MTDNEPTDPNPTTGPGAEPSPKPSARSSLRRIHGAGSKVAKAAAAGGIPGAGAASKAAGAAASGSKAAKTAAAGADAATGAASKAAESAAGSPSGVPGKRAMRVEATGGTEATSRLPGRRAAGRTAPIQTSVPSAGGPQPADPGTLSKVADKAESVADDAAKVASGAAKGAKIGAKVGGGAPGAIAGAVAGGTLGALKSKRGRRMLLISLAPQIALLAVFVMMVTAVFTIVTDTNSASAATEWSKAREAAERDGMSPEAARVAASAADGTAVPPVIILASAKESGVALDAEPEEYDDEARESAIDDDTPLGPHALIYRDTVRLAARHNIARPSFDDMVDPADSSRLYARLLGKIANSEKVRTPLDLGTGVVSIDGEPEATTGERSDEHDTFQLSDDSDDLAEAEKVKDDWVDILSDAPVEGAEERAERIYDQAFQWYLGISGGCLSGGGPAVSGQWANPIAAIGPPSGNGAFGPRPTSIGGGSGYHDGVDLNGTAGEGSPIYAAGSGIVTVVNSGGYGPNWVKIDHGGGIITEYGHMGSATVTSGSQVGAGTQIGTEGNMGTWSSGAHLHFSVSWAAQATDAAARGYVEPVSFFADRGITLGSNVVGVVVGSGDPTTSTGTAPPSQVGPDEVRVVQANIKTTTPDATFKKHLNEIVALAPDFVSFNEVSSRTAQDLTPSGYASYRDVPVYPVGESRGTAVAWRTDKWTMADRGRIQITKSGARLDNRWATWVTVNGVNGGSASMISVHAMINPRYHGTSDARIDLYRSGMENLNSLIETLSSRGPVFVAGDFNSRASDNDPWGPQVMLASSGMKSTFDSLGNRPPNASIDYVFSQPDAGSVALRHGTWALPDHPGLWADFKLDAAEGSTATGPSSTGGLPSSWTARPSSGSPVTLTSKQLGYAAQIAATGTTGGASDNALIIAFMTVMVESKFKMYASTEYPETEALPHDAVGTDMDSVGLFQQRPQSGWGDPASLMDIAYSTKAFFGGPSGPNGGSPPGLFDKAGWETMPKGAAAQAVQVSAFPDEYAKWEDAATELLGIVKGTAVPAGGECGSAAGGASYVVGSFNVLGNSHTEPGGNKANLGFDQYGPRLDSAVGYLQKYNVSVVGLQEFEPIQSRYLIKEYAGVYDVYPKGTNLTDAVAWRTADWTFVSGGTFAIPYFGGNSKPMPYVKLRHNQTGAESNFISIHNPADVRGPAAQFRTAALAKEKAMVEELGADGSDVLLVGDFNDVDEPHCALTPEMTSAFGAGTENPCSAPAAVHIDQIFGKGTSMLSGGVQNKDANNKQTSDHPLVTATVSSSLGGAPSSYDLGAVQPQTALVADKLGQMFGIQTVGGVGTRPYPTCHTLGLGLDFMVPMTTQGKAIGQQLADFATANAASLKIDQVIWQQQIWQTSAPKWDPMDDRGSATANHMDHVHVSVSPCVSQLY